MTNVSKQRGSQIFTVCQIQGCKNLCDDVGDVVDVVDVFLKLLMLFSGLNVVDSFKCG